MAEAANPHNDINRLSLRARMLICFSALVIPAVLAALASLLVHERLVSTMGAYLDQDARIVELALRSSAALAGAGATPAGQKAATEEVRNNMRSAAALAPDALKQEALDIGVLSYDSPPDKLAARLATLTQHATDASAATEARLRQWRALSRLVLLLAPAVALTLGMVLAYATARGMYRTLSDCIAFARDIADGKMPSRLVPDSKNEFDVLVVAVNDLMLDARHNSQLRHEHESRIAVLERATGLHAACSAALAVGTDEAAMLAAFCDGLAEAGGYRAAWIGHARHDADHSIELAAHAGIDRVFFEGLHLSWGQDLRRHAACGGAILLKKPQVVRDMADAPAFATWRGALLMRNLVSCIAVPLLAGGEVLGVLAVYASDASPCNDDEVALLQELAHMLAAGMERYQAQAARQHAELLLERGANYDALTGLPNRTTLEAQLARMATAAEASGKRLATLFVDLDRFKEVNDNLGHKVGDSMLVEVARRLESLVGEGNLVARPGNDEYVIVLQDLDAGGDAAVVAGAVVAGLAEALPGVPAQVRPLASVGISLYPDDGADVASLLRLADLAMQEAKSTGGNTFRFYAPAMNARMADRFAMEADLRQALEKGELLMHYQPQVSLVNGAITGAEALLRWRHPTRGMVAPNEFIRLAEETGLVLPLGEWAIGHVCAQLARWRKAGLAVPTVAINLSAQQFHQPGLVDVVRKALDANGLTSRMLELELSESAVMHDVQAAATILKQLDQMGVGVTLDDFGTGYSSLSYLKRFPLSHLKIDRSFVRDVTTSPDDAAICNAVISLAHSMHITVIAEGVDTEGQMHYLRRRLCDQMQGNHFSKALSGEAFAQLLTDGKRLLLPADRTQRTLLILDDEPNIVRALARALRPDGYKLLLATSAAEALQLLAVNEVQVVLSDQRMPEMSGTEFLAKVKDLYPETIRLILSGYADLESVIDAINRGAIYRFFTKPWEDEPLRRCIAEAFRQQQLEHGADAMASA
ncbi:EAL domain-containing protein [Duganella sp. LX20W]|uniref:EAL domain-containing protein n=1 Tax=Rugamonas brunnea TaxID=2758569 RepID=A0A7W2EUA7_9BURK|nr:EAL domain-containing protein [Rugamonas brunnea]MBA5638717.1 EAL domain-containing protein [Rugamonas brunnea]